MITIPPIPTTIVATCFTALVAALACVQFSRSRTPLRLGSAVMAVCGLSISALSIVYATDKMSLSIFWVYQFIAECIAVTWVISTIIQLGYAFYPLTRHQTLIWRTALASVIIYDLVAISELSYYCYAVWGSRSLGLESTPVVWIYWVRQLVKVLACAVTIAYLFVPLVRHHNSKGVAMIADSNTLAVGTWYLSALGITSLGYCAMLIYYMTKPDEVFSPQAQALDLCIRLLACPIFSLPPPRILLRHFQDKYGSGARDDNLNTMIEDGITNDPRPRRPAMLVAQSSFPSARQNDFFFDHPSSSSFLATRPSMDLHSNYATCEMEESQSKRYMEDDTHVAGTTSSSESTSAETNNGPGSSSDGNESDPTAPSSVSSGSPAVTARSTATETTSTSAKSTSDQKSYPVVGMDEAVLSNLGISTRIIDFQTSPSIKTTTTPSQHPSSPLSPSSILLNSNINNNSSKRDEDDETAIAARRISRRLTMEGRRDGLNFLNIAGRIKWPHRSNNGGGAGGGQSGTTSLPTMSTPPSPLAMKSSSSQSFPPMALNRSGPGRSTSGIDVPQVIELRGARTGGNRKDRLSAISSMLECDGVLENHDNDSFFAQKQQPLNDLSKKASSTITHNDNNNTISSSSNSTIRPPSPSVDTHNKTPAPSHISTELTAMDKIRRQSRDALTRLHDDGQAAVAATAMTSISTITGPHSPTLLRTTSMGTKQRDIVDAPASFLSPEDMTPTSTVIPSIAPPSLP